MVQIKVRVSSNLAYDFQNTEQMKKPKFYNQCAGWTVAHQHGRIRLGLEN